MGYKASSLEMSFNFAELVPKTHQEMKYFIQFKEVFGEDANTMAIGIKDSAVYEVENFKAYGKLCDGISALEGIDSTGAIGLPTLPYMAGKGSGRRRKFELEPIFEKGFLENGSVEDSSFVAAYHSKLDLAAKLTFLNGRILNQENGSTIILVPITSEYVNSIRRLEVVGNIKDLCSEFTSETGIEVHLAGLPFVRSIFMGEMRKEMTMFLYLSLGITALILLIFFRSFTAMFFPLIVIGVAVVWTMGTIVLCGFKVNIVTGLIPPIIVVIGIPNCIYLLNKYHQEYDLHNNKIKALSRVIRKIGIVTLITNCTTAVGFLVLISADITILRQFGIVAGINVLATFFISMILIPVVFSYLKAPTTRQLKHLDSKVLNKFLEWLDFIVQNRRKTIYVATIVLVCVTLYGSWKVYAVSYLVDDIPETSTVKQDLRWFERNFKGIMPLEIVINTHDPDAITKLDVLNKIDQLETFLVAQPEVSQSLSIIQLIKSARQSYYYNNPDFYALPTENDKGTFAKFLKNSQKGSSADIFESNLIDSTGQIRLSFKVADIGSKKMDTLVYQRIAPFADSLFQADKKYSAYVDYDSAPYRVTGTTLLFIKGNQFLLWNLRQSLIIAIVLIAIIMAMLFRSFKMIMLSLITNLIPLAITGALMGFFEIPLKPSTALIFSIAFGISVDDSIHYLAKYRQELFANNFSVPKAVSVSIRETGSSMIYTSIVLFAGFIIFGWSNFLGTVMLGVLTSCTLLFAMFTNLIVLPSLLLTFDSGKRNRQEKRLIDSYSEESVDEDDDNDLEKLELKPTEQVETKSEV